MKIKINQVLLGVDDKPLTNADDKTNLTLKDICINSLLAPVYDSNNKPEDGKKKVEKYEIYKLVKNAKMQDGSIWVVLTAEQITVIKKCIEEFQPQLILGQCFEMIEAVKDDEKKK